MNVTLKWKAATGDKKKTRELSRTFKNVRVDESTVAEWAVKQAAALGIEGATFAVEEVAA